MIQKEVTIQNETGLHARPASIFVRESSKFKSKVTLIKNDAPYNAKSILELLKMGASKGDKLIIQADGEDEEIALAELVALTNHLEG